MYINRHVCSRAFRDAVRGLYPGLDDDPAYWRLLEWALYAPWRDRDTARVVMHSRAIALYVGREDELRGRRWSRRRFLKGFGDSVFTIHLDHRTGFMMPAQLEGGVPDELGALFAAEMRQRGQRGRPERVYFASGRAYSGTEAAEEMRRIEAWSTARMRAIHGSAPASVEDFHEEERDEAEAVLAGLLCPDALALGEYLNGLAPRRFARLRERADVALSRLDELTAGKPAEYVAEQARILQAVKDRPKPFYGPSARTVRLFSVDRSILRLQTELRDVMTDGWAKCDLRSAQLAIVAKLWGVPQVEGYLAERRSIWNDLMDAMGVERTPETKGKLKDMLYSLIFGMGRRNLGAQLRGFFPDRDHQRAFWRFPVIFALLVARREQFRALRERGFGEDAYGNRHKIRKRPPRRGEDARWEKDNASSVMATIAQSYELRLMYPIVDLARRHYGASGFCVLAWLHDGCWIHVPDRREEQRWRSRIGAAVEAMARGLGMRTELEWG